MDQIAASEPMPRTLPGVASVDCARLHVRFPFDLNRVNAGRLHEAAIPWPLLQRGDPLIRAGDPASRVYFIRSGSMKSYSVSEEGKEQIMGFYLPGELLGLDGVYEAYHRNYCTALQTTSVWSLSFVQLKHLMESIPDVQHQLLKAMSRRMLEAQELIMLLNQKTAEERLATFILHLSARFSKQGLSPRVFQLPMSRADIANYLGMASETVSRSLSRLRSSRIIQLRSNELRIIDIKALKLLAGTRSESLRFANNEGHHLGPKSADYHGRLTSRVGQ